MSSDKIIENIKDYVIRFKHTDLAFFENQPILKGAFGKINLKIPFYPEEIRRVEYSDEQFTKVLNIDELLFQNQLKEINNFNEMGKLQIENFKIKDLQKLNKQEKDNYLYEISELYFNFCYFKNKKIEDLFKAIGIDEIYLKRFIPLEDIISEMNKIIDKKMIVFFRGNALALITLVLRSHIFNEIQIWGGECAVNYDGEKFANNDYLALKRELKKNGIEKKGKYDDLSVIVKLLGKNESEKIFLAVSKGNPSKNVLGILISICRDFSGTNFINEFFAQFFDLFKPIIEVKNSYTQGYELMSLQEYEYSKENAGKYSFQNISYETYKGKRIKEIYSR